METYLSVSDLSKKFRVSTTLIYDLIQQGIIPVIRLGNIYRISPKTVWEIEQSELFNTEHELK